MENSREDSSCGETETLLERAPTYPRERESGHQGRARLAIVFGSAIPFNLLLADRAGVRVRVRVLFPPAWAFGVLGAGLALGFGVESA